jgi:uncharacterized RDD family membrane protein YckC
MRKKPVPAGTFDLGGERQPCSLWRRLLIMLYDATAVIALLMAATALAMLAGFRELSVVRDPLYTLYLCAVWFGYLGWCWHRGGMTLGMRAWGVRIEREGGGRPGWGRSLARFLLSLVSAGAAGVGFLWSVVDSRRRTWHDRISGTLLYRVRPRG